MSSTAYERITSKIDSVAGELKELALALHANPELSFL